MKAMSREQYELLAVDYFDGRLGPAEEAALFAYLDRNPDLKEEFEAFREYRLEADPDFNFSGKPELKKNIQALGTLIHEDNFTEYFFDEAEGMHPASVSSQVQRFLQLNPFLLREFSLLKQSRLFPEDLPCPCKPALKKAVNFRLQRAALLAEAAIFALTILSAILQWDYTKQQDPVRRIEDFPAPIASLRPTAEARVIDHPGVIQKQAAVVNPDLHTPDRQQAEYNHPANILSRDRYPSLTLMAAEPFPDPGNLSRALQENARRNQYTSLLDLIALKNKIKEAELPAQDPSGPGEYIMNRVFTANGTREEPRTRGRFTFWDLAEAGIAGYNALSKKDIPVEHSINEDGRTVSVAFGNFGFSRGK